MNEKTVLSNGLGSIIDKIFKTRDELSVRNIRIGLLPLFLIFPMTVILGDFRYFNLNIVVAGFQSYELMLYPLGLGWLVLLIAPKRFIIPLLRIAAFCCALLLPFQFLIYDDIGRLAVFMAFQFFNGICAACAFSIFCFKLNNIERLLGMAMILFYYVLYYIFYREFEAVQEIYKTWGGAVVMVLYLVLIFALGRIKEAFLDDENSPAVQHVEKVSGAKLVILLHIIYYTIMCMINYIEMAEKIIYSVPYGLGQLLSIILIFSIMLFFNSNALYIWIMYLVFSLAGITICIFDSYASQFTGSLVYGAGDGLGYIIIYYLCAGAIKQSKSLKMYRLFCLIFFIEYFFISGILSRVFDYYSGSSHAIALVIVLVLSSVCFLLIPLLQKRLFETDWTDGLYLKGMKKYAQNLAETEAINVREDLKLTGRENEIFTLLLTGMSPKEIAYTLNIRYYTVNFHRNNLYRKLGIQSRAELFVKYGYNEHGKNQT